MEKITKNIVEISIAGKNVTGDVSRYLSKITYTDKEEEESDDVSLTFEDTSAIWQSGYYPEQGDTLQVKLGTPGNMLDCGLFEIDEIELELSPDTLTVKGIATAITQSLRTRNSKAFEKQSLRKIAQYFADKHQLKLIGKTGELQKIEIGRKTQDNQTDISFLTSLAKEYGLIFSVRGDRLVFMDEEELDKQDSILTIDRSQMSKARFRDKTSQTFSSAVISKRNVKTNKVVRWKIEPSGKEGEQDVLVINGSTENDGQAKAKTESSLKKKNNEKVTGSFSVPGNPQLVAGVNIELTGIGAFSGKWHIVSSTHTIDTNGGYITDVEVRKIIEQ